MAELLMWVSPSEAADMVYDVREEGVDGLGYALLRPRRNGRDNTTPSLAYAKLNQVEPIPGLLVQPIIIAGRYSTAASASAPRANPASRSASSSAHGGGV